MGGWVLSTMRLLWWLFNDQFDWVKRFLERWLDHASAVLTTGLIHLCLQLNVLLRAGAQLQWSLPMGLWGDSLVGDSLLLYFPATMNWAVLRHLLLLLWCCCIAISQPWTEFPETQMSQMHFSFKLGVSGICPAKWTSTSTERVQVLIYLQSSLSILGVKIYREPFWIIW